MYSIVPSRMHLRSEIWNHALLASRVNGTLTVAGVCDHLDLDDEAVVQEVLGTMCEQGWLVQRGQTYHATTPAVHPSPAPSARF
jgi:hypothetical protein